MYKFLSNDLPAAARISVWKYEGGKRIFQFYRNVSALGSFVIRVEEGYYDFIVQGYPAYSYLYFNCGAVEKSSNIVKATHKIVFRNLIKLGTV